MSVRYASPAAQPSPVAEDVISRTQVFHPATQRFALPSHAVTSRSIDHSWKALTGPLKTKGLVPSDYSSLIQDEFNAAENRKRLDDLARATVGVRAASASSSRQRSIPAPGGKRVAPMSTTARGSATNRIHTDPFRPRIIPQPKPKTYAPRICPPTGRQLSNYTPRNSYYPVPNPAHAPADAKDASSFPWNTAPAHHRHALNPQQDAGYYSTHWDDHFGSNPYQPQEVYVLGSSRPEESAAATSASSEAPTSPSASSAAASSAATTTTARPTPASLGFGKRHSEYMQYIHHSVPTPASLPPTTRQVAQQDRILLPVSSHLLTNLSPSAANEASKGLALSVPYHLARYVPLDSRDGDGKKGHALASGLGYGKGHRNHYKYVHDNRAGNPELAYFRSNHCT